MWLLFHMVHIRRRIIVVLWPWRHKMWIPTITWATGRNVWWMTPGRRRTPLLRSRHRLLSGCTVHFHLSRRTRFIGYFCQANNSLHNRNHLPAFQIKGERYGQQEIFSNGLQSVPLLCEHHEVHLVSRQLCHHLMPQVAHSL